MEPLLSGLSTFFPWLMDYTIDISILICLIFIIKSIATKKLPAWWHYSLWMILLLRMIIPWEFESPLNIPNIAPVSVNESLFESTLIEEEFITSEFKTELSSNPLGWHVQIDDVLLFLWLACAIIFGMYILIKYIKFWNTIKKEPPLTEKKALDLLEECKNRMKTHVTLKITITDKVKSPALFGYIRPRLLLPVGVLEKLDDAELSYIFMHELGHLKRHDIGVSWIVTFLQIFQWFNPFVWLAFYQMRIDQEAACDASVLSRIKHDQTIDYAGTIVGFLENFYRNHKLPALVGILENQNQIKNRINRIINYRKYSKMMMFFSTALLIIIGVIFYSLAGSAKENHDRPVLDSSIVQVLPFEVQEDLAIKDSDVKYEKEAVKFTGGAQKEIIVAQDIGVKDEVELEKQNLQIQKAMLEVPDNDIKDEIESEKFNPGTQIVPVEAQDNNVKDEMKTVRLTEGTQEAPAEALEVLGEDYNTYPENKDILKYYSFAAYENEQYTEAALLSENIYKASEEKSMKKSDLASSVYQESENPDDAKGTPDIPENEPDEGEIHNLNSVDEHPKIVSIYPPRYPFQARVKGIEGRVLLKFVVDKAGYVMDPQVVSAEPEGIFEQAALDTVIKYRLTPAMKDSKRVSSVVKLPISFALNDKI